MEFTGWVLDDFDVFHVPGFDERMQAIRARIQPKLDALGRDLLGLLQADTGTEWFYHVAKHMRRSINPPADTWVALNRAKKGYKATVHFGVGVSALGANVSMVVKPECLERDAFAAAIEHGVGVIRPLLAASGTLYVGDIPNAPQEELRPVRDTTADEWLRWAEHLRTRKNFEFEMGSRTSRDDAVTLGGDGLVQAALNGIRDMLPLYQAAVR